MGCAKKKLFKKKEANIDWPIIQYFWNIGYSPIEVGISLDQSLKIETNVLPYGEPFSLYIHLCGLWSWPKCEPITI
jgi:hypothetical protein